MRATIGLAAALLAAQVALSPLALPGASGAIGFDDLTFASELHALLVPAGRTGRLYLVEPGTRAIASVEGFSSEARGRGGHGDGTTSADAGQGRVFAIDRTGRFLAAVDPDAGRIVARASLAGGPDYVRWVGQAREAWVTEPGRQAIETFRFERASPPRFTRTGNIPVPDGPESLAVDATRRRAYTNTWRDATLAIDLDSRRVVSRWVNGCRGARGLALDADRGLLFVGCDEGRVVALDVAHGGAVLGSARVGVGVDVIAYGPRLSHLYVPAAESANLTVVGVGGRGDLRALGAIPTAAGAHCAAADDRGNVYVCDPEKGRLLVLRDPYPASR